MKLVVTLPVRDEEDILQICLDYYLKQGVDHIIAMNNLSIDGTLDILDKYSRLGVLTRLDSNDPHYNQDIWVNKMSELAVDMGADWIIPVDADEFWWPNSGTLKEQLSGIGKNIHLAMAERWNFVPVDELPWLETHIYRDLESLNTFGSRILPKICLRGVKHIKAKHGNHKATFKGKQAHAPLLDVDIFHFPIRGYKQLENKVKVGGAAYKSNPELWPKTPILELYRLYQEGNLYDYYTRQLISHHSNQKRLNDGLITADYRLCQLMSA